MPSPLAHLRAMILALILAPLTAGAAEVQPIPHPDLDQLPPGSRALLEPALKSFREAREGETRPGVLADLYGSLAMHYHAQGLMEPAQVAYENALANDPDHFRWMYYLAFLHDELDQNERAISLYGRALQTEPDYMPARVRLAQVATEEGMLDLAEREYTTVLDKSPTNAPALAGLGEIRAAHGQHMEAIELFDDALESQPDADRIHGLLAHSYRAIGEEALATEHARQEGERIAFLADPLIALMVARSRGSTHFLNQGLQLLQERRLPAAKNAFAMAVRINPEDRDARASLARVTATLGDEETALAMLEALTAEHPDYPVALKSLAELRLRRGQPLLAVPHLRRAISLDPDIPSQAMLADALYAAGDFRAAAEAYLRLGDVPPDTERDRVDPMFMAALASLQAGDCRSALDHARDAFARRPQDPRMLSGMVRIASTCDAAEPAERERALGAAAQLYETYPGQESAELLAMAYAANGGFDLAVEFQTQAIFEAYKAGTTERTPQLRANMQRYEAEQSAVAAWPEDHAVFDLSLSGIGDAEGS